MPSRKSPPPAARSRILLVDDNRSGLAARRAVLEEIGYTVDCASDARSGLELFSKHHHDLVVTDFRMPDMDGAEFIACIRKRSPEIPIVLLSGFVEALGLTENNTGSNSVIMKSAREVQHLTSAVKRLLKAPRKPPRPEAAAAPPKSRKSSR